VPVDVSLDEEGITLTTGVTFPRRVMLSDPRVHIGQTREPAWLWPLDGRDHEGEDLDPLTVPAGIPVSVSSTIRLSCDTETSSQRSFTISDRDMNGTTRVHEFTPTHDVALPPAVQDWCAIGPSVRAGMEHLEPDGDAVIGVYIINSSPDSITVRVSAYADEHVTWSEASAVVPSAEKARIEIRGTNVGCEPGEIASWAGGRLLIDGEPYQVPMDDAWC
jgi:hypothetical protein